MNHAAAWVLWGKQFKGFRLRAGYASQNDFADALSRLELPSGNHLDLSSSQISRWENGQRCPSKRALHLDLITGFIRLGGIHTRAEADSWLQAGDRRVLSEEECTLLFGIGSEQCAAQPISTRPIADVSPPDYARTAAVVLDRVVLE